MADLPENYRQRTTFEESGFVVAFEEAPTPTPSLPFPTHTSTVLFYNHICTCKNLRSILFFCKRSFVRRCHSCSTTVAECQMEPKCVQQYCSVCVCACTLAHARVCDRACVCVCACVRACTTGCRTSSILLQFIAGLSLSFSPFSFFLYICTYIYMYIYIYIYIQICLYINLFFCGREYMYIYIYIYFFKHVYI